jgi:hypothetical protein
MHRSLISGIKSHQIKYFHWLIQSLNTVFKKIEGVGNSNSSKSGRYLPSSGQVLPLFADWSDRGMFIQYHL